MNHTRTFKITFEGEQNWDILTNAVAGMDLILKGLEEHSNKEGAEVDWEVEQLSIGSFGLAIAGHSASAPLLDRIREDYEQLGASIEQDRPLDFPSQVLQGVRRIASTFKHGTTSVRFSTANVTSLLTRAISVPHPTLLASKGEVTGTVETLNRRKQRYFVLYDDVWDRAVKCYYTDAIADRVITYFGKHVSVFGTLQEHALTGRVVQINDIKDVDLIDEPTPGAALRAAGALANLADDRPVAELVGLARGTR